MSGIRCLCSLCSEPPRNCLNHREQVKSNSLFVLSDSDSDSGSDPDSKRNGRIALCRIFHTVWSQIQIPILTANHRNGIGI